MPLTRVNFAPGIDKQNTTVGAEGRWVDCNNVRFRYQLPEKVGGWSSLVTDTIVGVARKMFPFVYIVAFLHKNFHPYLLINFLKNYYFQNYQSFRRMI